MAASSHHSIEVVVVVRELANGYRVAFPAAAPELVSYGTESSCLEEQRLFLAEYLKTLPATRLEPFRLASEVTLEEVEVTVPRNDLPRRLRRLPPMTVPCLVIPSGRAAWVVVLPLRHTFYAEDAEEWRAAAADEIVRVAAAREPSPAEYLELLPAESHRLERLRLRVERPEHGSGGADDRRAEARQLDEEAALRRLAEIGEPPPRRAARRELVGRDSSLHTLESLLAGSERLSVAVVGREQVGKSALIAKALAGRASVFVTSGARLIAGQSFFGQWQQRLHDVMEAAESVDAVLWFDNLADLFAARGEGQDFAGALRPYLDRRRVRLVGELSPEVFDKASLRHVGFMSQLQALRLKPLDAEATLQILDGRRRRRQRRGKGPSLDAGAVEPLVELAGRYFPYRAFPGAAVRLYEEVLAHHAGELDATGSPPRLGAAEVFAAVSAETGIPAFLLRDDRALKLSEIRRAFERRVIGQRHAVDRVARTLCTVKASLQPAGRPLAVFLFVGPTGVGKTEVARTLASFLFGSEERMVRFDMSEYSDARAAERLIRGTDREEGLLTRRIRQQPFSILLLDEIEKASPAVFDLLLQVMGEARLTDARGKTTYFHNTLLIMTSNLGAARPRSRPGFAGDEPPPERYFREQVEEHFRPELVNRLDRVVAFEELQASQIERIAELAVARLGHRHGLAQRGIRLSVDPGAVAELARGGYNPAYGARQLYRHLEEHLAAPLARLLASRGEAAFGATVEVRWEEGGPRFDLRPAPRRGRRTSARDLDAIAELRREVGRHLRMERLQELRDRIELLTVQLAYGGDGRRRGVDSKTGRRRDVDVARLQADHRRLSEVWERLAAVRCDIEEAEEMALMAVAEGEEAAPLLAQVRSAWRRWHAALPFGLLALEKPRPGVSLLASELDGLRGLELWLGPLLVDAERRRWTVSALVPGEGANAWDERSAGELKDLLAAWERQLRRRRGRLVLHVAGPWAWALLATEAGLHRFKNEPRRLAEGLDEPVHLRVERLTFTPGLTEEQRKRAGRLLRQRPEPPNVLARSPAVRVYDFRSGELEVGGRAPGELPFADYWPDHEQIAAAHLLVYEEAPERDRDAELLSVLFDG